MKFKLKLTTESSCNNEEIIIDIATLTREKLSQSNLGLSLSESKDILTNLQKIIVETQVARHIKEAKVCSDCDNKLTIKGYHKIKYRSLFGKVDINSPRLNNCNCSIKTAKTFSPISTLLKERMSPEFCYLQTKWASLMSYGMTVDLLTEVLPLETNVASIFKNIQKTATRLENELTEEKYSFIDCCQNDIEKQSKPDTPITVGIDGGYGHARDGDNRKAGWFEVIVGKSLQENKAPKRFGFVSTYDKKPKRRLYDMLIKQGMQINQNVTFLSDGAENLRDLQVLMNPNSEHILDWFHIAMRFTVILNLLKGSGIESKNELQNKIEGVKWYLWHGNAYRALERLYDLNNFELDYDEDDSNSNEAKLSKAIDELFNYIRNNSDFIVNYGDRYQYGEHISTGFVESTVNELISKRMAKKQQMRWTKKGAHLLLQVRIKTLNEELKDCFDKWYGSSNQPDSDSIEIAA